jgi:hypothetical protein
MHTAKGKELTLNGMKFVPNKDARYLYDYEEILSKIQEGTYSELDTYRELFLNDLWFVVYFILKVPPANHPWVVDTCREVQEGPISHTLDLWAREHFKCQDVNTLVPTPDGYKKHGDLKIGDYVYSPSGRPVKVVGRSETFTNKECWQLTFDCGQEVICSADHLWWVGKKSRRRISGTKNQRHYRDYSIKTTREIVDHGFAPDNRLTVPLASAFECPEIELTIPPYTLGAWLGDGCRNGGSGFTCGKGDTEIIENIRADGFDVIKGKSAREISWHIQNFTHLTRKIGVFRNKHIPEEYFRSSIPQRMDLLRGLMDTDGTVDDRGTATFVSKSEVLASGLKRLANSLGLYASLRKVGTKYNGKPYTFYQVSFQAYRSNPPFKLARKVALCKEKDRVYRGRFIVAAEPVETRETNCIKVESEDGLYVITENHITTHNTTILTTAEPIQYRIKRAVIDNVEETTGIFAYNRPVAKAFLRGIKNVFEHSEFLKDLFPTVCWRQPEKEAPKWSEDDGLVLKRTSFQKESCFEAYGLIEGMPTSKHFSRRLYDDISTLDLVQTPEMMEKVKSRFSMSSNLGTMDGTHRVCGTIYDFNDILVALMSKKTQDGSLIYHVRKKPATDDGTFTGNPVLLPVARNEELKADPKSYATQQLIDPTLTGEEKLFAPELLIEVEPETIPQDLFKFMTVDTAGDKKTSNGRDAWAILLCGVKPVLNDLGQSEVTILDACIERLEFDEALKIIVDMYIKGGIVHKVGVESMGASMFDTHVANALRAKGRIVTLDNGNLVKLQAAGRKKTFRIESALSWPFKNGMIRISKGIPVAVRDRLRMEMDKFPYWHEDGLDALSYQYELFKDFRFAMYQPEETDEDAYERKYKQMQKQMNGDGWMYV